jgi:surface protein
MKNMFTKCSNLTSLDVSNFDTSNVTNMYGMFDECDSLISLDLSNFDFGKVKNVNFFIDLSYTSKLANLNFGINLGKGYTSKTQNYSDYKLDITYARQLTHDSLMSIINNLYDLNLTYDVANGGTLYRQQLKLGSTNLAKLTAEEIAIATNKGWNVS